MENTRRRRSGGLRNIVTAVFAVAFVASIVSTITAFAAANLFKIQNAELSELSTTAEGSISSFDEENIASSVTFHKLNDSAKYTITLKNTDTKDHIIESITDDNINPYISYEYDQHMDEQIDAGSDFVFVITAKYSTAITNIDQRARVSNVKFFIHFTDIEEEILIVPNTGASSNSGNFIRFSVISLVISAAGLTIAGIFALKKHKKASKYIVAGIVTVAAITTTATVKAVTVEINSFTISTDITLKDKLAVTYTDKNGNEQELIVNYGEQANIPDQNKDGYTLTGWEDENGNLVDPTQPTTEDIKIHPIYCTHTYTIKFNGNGANGEMANLAMTYDEAKTLPANAFDFPGRTYTGWDTAANGSGVHYDNESEVKNLTAEDNGIATLYAQWSVNPFHIDYDGNGATSGDMATTNCEYDQACQLRDNAFEKYGYDFAGWKYNDTIYTDKADATNIIDKGTITMVAQWTPHAYTITYTGLTSEEAAALRTAGNPETYTIESPSFTLKNPEDRKDADGDMRERFVGWVEIIEPSTSVTLPMVGNLGNKTFNATWGTVALPEYDITYNYDGGNVATANPTKLNKEQSATLNEPEKTGYTFTGWTGTTISGDTPVKPYTIPAPHQRGNLEYTAHYRAHTYTVNFDINTDDTHVSGTMQPLVISYDEEKALTANAFTRTGYTFAGWKLGDTEYTDGTTVKNLTAEDGATVTLKAQWKANKYKLVFHANSGNVTNPTAMTDQEIAYDVTAAINSNSYDCPHYKFMGWATAETGAVTYEDGAEVTNLRTNNGDTVDLYAVWKERTAYLRPSSTSSGLNSVVFRHYAATAKSFIPYDGTPNLDQIETKHNIVQSGSNFPVYVWLDGDTLYWWSEAEVIYMNADSASFFSGLTHLETIDIAGFDSSLVTDLKEFYANTKITSVDLSPLAAAHPTTLEGMFRNTTALESVDLSPLNTDQTTTIKDMFNGSAAIETVNLAAINTANVTDMSGLFQDCTNLKNVDFSQVNLASVENMSSMFLSDKKLENLNFTGVNTPNLQKMDWMFARAKIANLDLSDLDTGNVTSFGTMFYYSDVATLDISGFDTHNAKTFGSMFAAFNGHGQVLDLSNFDTTNLIGSMYEMFSGARVSVIDLSSFNISEGRAASMSMTNIFNIANSVKTIYTTENLHLNPNANLSVPTDYAGQSLIVGGAGTTLRQLTNAGVAVNDRARIDDPDNGKPGIFTIKGARYIRYHDNDGDDTNDEANYTLMTSGYLKAGEQLKKNAFTRRGFRFTGWKDADSNEYTDEQIMADLAESKTPLELYAQWEELTAILDTGANVNAALRGLTAAPTAFKHFDGENLPDFDNLDGKVDIALSSSDTPVWAWADGNTIYWWSEAEAPKLNAASNGLFAGRTHIGNNQYEDNSLKQLTSIDMTGLDVSTATNMNAMFSHDSNLVRLNLGDFNAASAKTMSSMFINTTSLKNLDLSKFESPAAIDMSSMFNGSGVTSLDLSQIESSTVTNMTNMFYGVKMDSLDASKLNTSSATAMDGMFRNATIGSLKFYDQENPSASLFDTSNVQTMNNMFAGTKTATIDVSNFNTSKVTSLNQTFSRTTASTINVANWNTSKVTNMYGTFLGVTLTDLDLSHFNTALVTSLQQMFDDATIINLNLSGWTNNNVTSMSYMFRNFGRFGSNEQHIDFTNFKTPALKSMFHMFDGYNAINLKVLDLSSFDTSNVTDMQYAFGSTESNAGIRIFDTIYTSDKFVVSDSIGDDITIFGVNGHNGKNLTGGAGTEWNNANPKNKEYARIDDPDNGKPGYFTIKGARYIRYNGNGADNATPYGAMTSEYLKAGDSLKKNAFVRDGYVFTGWKDADNNDYTNEQVMADLTESKTPLELYAQWKVPVVDFIPAEELRLKMTSLAANDNNIKQFMPYPGTPDLDNISYEIVSTNESDFPIYMWYDSGNNAIYYWCEWERPRMYGALTNLFSTTSNIENVDFSAIDLSGVTSTTQLFSQKTKLKSVDFGNWDASNVTDMYRMFYYASSLETVDLSNFNTTNLQGSLEGMFDHCASLKSIDFGDTFKTDNVMNMHTMFQNNTLLEELDLSSFNTGNVETMYYMFANDTALASIDFGNNFNTANVTNMGWMFFGCNSLNTLDLSAFSSDRLTTATAMFRFAPLQTIYATDSFNLENIDETTAGGQMTFANTNLIGGMGTSFATTDHKGASYGRIDNPDDGKPGYFTIKGARYIRYNGNGADNATSYGAMTSEYLKAGDSLKKNAFTRSGYVFTGWKDADNNEYTDEQVMADLAESKTPLELYAQWDAAPYTVTFNANGGEVLQGTKMVTYLQPYGELPTPVKYDYANSILGGKYSFKEWNTKADGSGDTIISSSIYANTDDTTLYAIWNDHFIVTIYNGESETPTIASYGIDDTIDLHAQDVAGKQFLYWEVDGAKKSYLKDCSMHMFQGKDLTIRAVYGSEGDLESQQPGIYISDIYRQYSDNRVVVRSYSYVPEEYEIVKAGVIATLDANIANGTFDDQTATYVRAGNVNGSNDNYYYTWSKSNVTSEQTVYVKAYLQYKDADGVEHTIYGDLVTATLTE